jgi:citrate synthase
MNRDSPSAETNLEFWSAVVPDFAQVPAELFVPLFACARTAGWSALILEQKREARLIRTSAVYVGESECHLGDLAAMPVGP